MAAGPAADRLPAAPAAEGTTGDRPGDGALHLESCSERCVPGKLIFLPCMAVGARNMAACRQWQVEQCRVDCERRRGPEPAAPP